MAVEWPSAMRSLLFTPRLFLILGSVALLAASTRAQSQVTPWEDAWRIDFRYAPAVWQTSICLPDDWQKTLVGKDGSLLYDYPGKFSGFGTRIVFGTQAATTWLGQALVSPRVPIVRTLEQSGDLEIELETFAVPPDRGAARKPKRPTNDSFKSRAGPPEPDLTVLNLTHHPTRYDIVIVHLRNAGKAPIEVTPTLTVESLASITAETDGKRIRVGAGTEVQCPEGVAGFDPATNRAVVRFRKTTVPGRGHRDLAFGVARGASAPMFLQGAAHAERLHSRAERFWRDQPLPYDALQVPDAGVQALLDSAVRNIFQAREIKKGLPAFQVGPTCYRGLWVVDGSFIMEAMAYLGRQADARAGIQYLMSFQRDDGGFLLIDGHWKETGIALWAITRHARLTDDRAWLREVWPRVRRGVGFIQHLRRLASADATAPNCGLIPEGFSDGGLADKVPEYTNIYWTLAGWRAAIDAARWLGLEAEADAWGAEYDDFYRTFRRAADRDSRLDALGHRFVPIRMRGNTNLPPQKAQWGFLHAVFPGKVFAADDALVKGNMAMLRAVEREGLVLDTGWLKDGIWNYFASFYGHAWLWLGDGGKAARTLYAFGNHASPLLVWREEQKPVGEGSQFVGDMPHNWASAEFIRLVRHLLVLERGNELHLFEGLPAAWAKPGAVTRVHNLSTEFGALSFEFRVSSDGKSASLRLDPPMRAPPNRIVLHLDHWSGQTGTTELPTRRAVRQRIRLAPRSASPGPEDNFARAP